MPIDKDYKKLAVKALQAPVTEGPRGHPVREVGPTTLQFITPPLPSARRASVSIAQQELAWMIGGCAREGRSAQVTPDVENIWSPWDKAGYGLGPVYGVQWDSWRYVDDEHGPDSLNQLDLLISGLKADPMSRRHVLTMWQPGELDQMALPPCPMMHVFSMFQGRLWLSVFARSTDIVCGLPVDLLEAYMLNRMVCAATGLRPGGVMFTSANMHLYHGHEQIMELYLDPPGFDADPQLVCLKQQELKRAGDLSPVDGRDWKAIDYRAPIVHAEVLV